MPYTATVGQILVNRALPPDLRDHSRVLDKKGLEELAQKLVERGPDVYRDVTRRLNQVGKKVAYRAGGFSFGAGALAPSRVAQRARAEIEAEIDRIESDESLDDDERERRVLAAVGRRTASLVDDVYREARESKNPLALQVMSGARGKPFNINSLIGFDGQYVDHKGELVPVPILSNYADGLSPAEYFAGAYGARKGVIDTKKSTADAGFFGKQLVQAAHRLVVTAKDADEDDEFAADRGLPADVDDGDNEGALLSREVGGYPRNTVLTPRVLADLKARGHKRILVRSPLVGGPPDGGVYARDVGVREKGAIAPVGDFVGVAAAQAIAEKMSQSMLGSKHSGGVAGAEKATGGFGLLNAMVQAPKVFPGGAAVSELDGNVSRIEPAPQGGHYVYVGDKAHYVSPANEIAVKVGDTVEAGDALDDGIPNPAKVVEHKGLGEGRRYFLKAFGRAYANSGMRAHRRNLELVTRGLLNHVELTEELEDSPYVPGDVVPYDLVARSYQPRDDAQHVTPAAAVGRYLERPVLHHTIGTRIRPSMLKEIEEFGIKNLYVHDKPPPFRATMVRGMANLQHDPDWMTRQLGSGLKRPFLDAAARGFSSDESGTSFVPAMANRPSFGRQGKTQGWQPPAPGGKSLLAAPRASADFKPPAPTA